LNACARTGITSSWMIQEGTEEDWIDLTQQSCIRSRVEAGRALKRANQHSRSYISLMRLCGERLRSAPCGRASAQAISSRMSNIETDRRTRARELAQERRRIIEFSRQAARNALRARAGKSRKIRARNTERSPRAISEPTWSV